MNDGTKPKFDLGWQLRENLRKRIQRQASQLNEAKELLMEGFESIDTTGEFIDDGVYAGFVSVKLRKEWFDAARKIVEEMDEK